MLNNNHLLKFHVDDGMEPFDQILPALIDMPIGVNSTHLGMFSPGPEQDQLPDTTEIFVSYIFHGIKYIQCATDPYPQGFPKDLAREHVTSIKERINAFEYHEADIHRFWDIVNNLEAAISVCLHDLNHFYLDVILDDLRAESDVPDGFIHHIVLALALGNIHAARFLSKWYAGPSNTAPTPLQATTILEAAKRTRHGSPPAPHPRHFHQRQPRRDRHHFAHSGPDTLKHLDDIEILGVPSANAEFLRHSMRNAS